MENQKHETLEELRERLAKEQIERDKKHAENMRLIKKATELAWQNLKETIIFNHKLDEFNKKFKSMLEESNKKLESMVGDKE